jgi:hypothetical protein
VCIDDLDISVSNYEQPRPELLRCDDSRMVEESVHSHLLKSNCPVTGQPDWGSVAVEYRGGRWITPACWNTSSASASTRISMSSAWSASSSTCSAC